MTKYNPQKIEKKWQDEWDKSKIYRAEDNSKKPKYYCLIEFPYPSGAGLHVGHLRSHIAIDIVARKKRMSGHNVLYPIGWDAFGLPTENFAIKTKTHPKIVTENNIKNFTRQIKSYGPSFDWSREINTTDSKYYKWTQWIFLKLFNSFYDEKSDKARDIKDLDIPKNLDSDEKRKYVDDHRMAYELEMAINWCPSCKIGLANEEVVNGACERCGAPAEKKMMKQWMLRITKYAERLINDLDTVDYLEKIKTQQVNWIGKSEGATVKFQIKDNIKTPEHSSEVFGRSEDNPRCKIQTCHSVSSINDNKKAVKSKNSVEPAEGLEPSDHKMTSLDPHHTAGKSTPDSLYHSLKVFTTRPDTLFGCTYMVVSPEHTLIKNLESRILNLEEVKRYINKAKNKSDLDRTDLAKEKTGVELEGIKAINPVNNEEIPIWVADYVLVSYGTGAIMAVPAHDERDFEFAKKYNLPIYPVVAPNLGELKNKEEINSMLDIIKEVDDILTKNKIRVWFNGTFGVIGYYGKIFTKPSDVDCGVLEKDFNKARQIIEKCGYKKIEDKINFEFKVSIYKKNNIIFEIGTFNCDLGNTLLKIDNIEIRVPESSWLAKCYRITANKEKRKDKNDLQRAIFLELISKNINEVYVKNGVAINSGKFNGLTTDEAKKKMIDWLEKNNLGKKAVNYKLRDWVFSRQHYWGEPIPIVKCEKCGNVALEKKDLPLELPEVKNYEPTDTGESPLAKIDRWVNIKCPKCKGYAKRETDTMPNWAGSSWYYLRYIDPDNNREFASQKKLKHWMPVNLYNGGMEHTTLHLLYSRFWHKFLYDLGYVNTAEPYKTRRSHGMILAEDGQKMSKSRGNTINPDEVIKQYGADTVRLYEMFMGPYSEAIPWNTNSLIGMNRFLEKVWNLQTKVETRFIASKPQTIASESIEPLLHKTIKKVTEDIENLKFNTAISQLMIFLNKLEKEEKIFTIHYSQFLILLSPFAPHITEELWRMLGNKESIHLQKWPEYNKELIKEKETTLVIQINGKLRDQIKVPADISEKDAKKLTMESEKIKKWIDGKEIRKIIFVKGKLINVVV